MNLADIARLAGVSLATASRALNDAYGVAPSTRARVLEVAAQLDYVVSPTAVGLASGSTGRVAIVVPHIDRWFFSAMLAGLEAVLTAAGLDVLLYHVDDAEDRRNFFRRLPARRKVDAVIVVAFPVDDLERKRLELMGVSIVAAGGQDAAYPSVHIDDEAAGRQAVDHLLHLRHRRIGLVASTDPDQPDPSTEGRFNAYYASLRRTGVPVDPALVIPTVWGGIPGAEAMEKLLSLPDPPTAVFAHSDEVAFGVLRTLRRAGLRVPQDMSVIGIDDHPMSELLDLTTVRQSVRDQATIAGELLLALMRGEEVARTVTVPTQLVVRGSTGPPRT